MKPDYTCVLPMSHTWRGEYDAFQLSSGGFLLAITVETDTEYPNGLDKEYRAEFEITDRNEAALYQTMKWNWRLTACGVAFPEPLINMNSKYPYVVKRLYPEKCPDLRITAIHAIGWE